VQPGLVAEQPPDERRPHPLWVQAVVMDDELLIDWRFSVDRNRRETLAVVADRFLETLRLLGSAEQTGV
jgi:hypothetical protein